MLLVPNQKKENTSDLMPPEQFRAWRRNMGLKQKEAADLLGLKKRMIQYYEKGRRDGKTVTIPKSVRLACYALSIGVGDYDGNKPHNLDLSQFLESKD
nr:helix-turn-helix transcriptional regulator [uncultured Cohaesibacter sp.]